MILVIAACIYSVMLLSSVKMTESFTGIHTTSAVVGSVPHMKLPNYIPKISLPNIFHSLKPITLQPMPSLKLPNIVISIEKFLSKIAGAYSVGMSIRPPNPPGSINDDSIGGGANGGLAHGVLLSNQTTVGSDNSNKTTASARVSSNRLASPASATHLNFVDKFIAMFYKWWNDRTQGRSGILIYIMPALLSQLLILGRAVPFFVGRLTQYLQPIYVAALISSFQPKGLRFMQQGLFSSIILGAVYMLYDTYRAGSDWMPAYPSDDDAYALITSSTSAIGRELAKLLYLYGYNVILVGSSASKLKALHSELDTAVNSITSGTNAVAVTNNNTTSSSNSDNDINIATEIISTNSSHNAITVHTPKIVTLVCNLVEPGSAAYILKELKAQSLDDKVEILINSAGSTSHGRLMNMPLDHIEEMIDGNIKSVVMLARLLAPRIAKRGCGGRILMMGSLTGLGPSPHLSVYAATNAFLASFSSSLRREMLPYGVLVSLAIPGPIDNQHASYEVRQSFVYRLPGVCMNPMAAATSLFHGVVDGTDVIVPGTFNKLYAYVISRALPAVSIASLTQLAWTPAPSWIPFLRPLPKVKSVSVATPTIRHAERTVSANGTDDSTLQHRINSFKRTLRQMSISFWYSPIINYNSLKKLLLQPFSRKGNDVVIDDSVIADSGGDVGTGDVDLDALDGEDLDELEDYYVRSGSSSGSGDDDDFITAEGDEYVARKASMDRIIEKLKKKIRDRTASTGVSPYPTPTPSTHEQHQQQQQQQESDADDGRSYDDAYDNSVDEYDVDSSSY